MKSSKRYPRKTTGTISLQFQNAIQAKSIDGKRQEKILRKFQNAILAKAIDGKRQEPISR